MTGPGRREAADAERRQRLMLAMLAACDERGYEAVTVADLLEHSGLSRAYFYSAYDSKSDCFAATLSFLLEEAIASLETRLSAAAPEDRLRSLIGGLIELVATYPAAARLCMVEAMPAGQGVGPAMVKAYRRLAEMAHEALEVRFGQGTMPPDLSLVVISGVYQLLFRRLLERDEDDVAELVEPLLDLATRFQPPPVPLRLAEKRRLPPDPPATTPFGAFDTAEWIVRAFASAVASQGYTAVTISDIAREASISQSTFYEYFDGKPSVLAAAIDSSGAQLAAAVLPAVRRSPGWPQSVRSGFGAACRYFAAEPAFARLRLFEVYAADRTAILQRDAEDMPLLDAILFGPGTPRQEPLLSEMLVGAFYALFSRQALLESRAETLELAPMLTYACLVPVLGPEQAAEVANSPDR